MAAECEMFMNCNKNFIDFYKKKTKKQIWLQNKEYLRDHTCEIRNNDLQM